MAESTRWDRRDLYNWPTLISLTRAPLAVAFVLSRGSQAWMLGVLAAAGLSDVLDGWLARRLGQASSVGAFVDGLVDKIFVLTVVLTLLVSGRITWVEMVMLGARDLGEGLLIGWAALRAPGVFLRVQPHAVGLSKATTVLQFGAVIAAIGGKLALPLAVGAAVLGGATAAAYGRELWQAIRRDKEGGD